MKELISNIGMKKHHDIFFALSPLLDKEKYSAIDISEQIGTILSCLTETSSAYANIIDKKNFFSILPMYNKIEQEIEKLGFDVSTAGLSMHVNTMIMNIKVYCRNIEGIE